MADQNQPLTAEDEGYGGSYTIHKPARLWNDKEIKHYNQELSDAAKNFGKYLDVDANGKPVKAGIFGGQKYYRMRLNSTGEEVFVKGVQANPGILEVKPTNVRVEEGNWNPVEIRSGSGKLAAHLAEVQGTTDPKTGHPATVDANNPGQIESAYNNLLFSNASLQKQGQAQEITDRFRQGQNTDRAYAAVEQAIRDLGPDKLKEMTDWASRTAYATGVKTPDQMKFYRYLGALAALTQSGSTITGEGAPRPISGAALAGNALAGLSFMHPFSGVSDVLKAVQSGEIDPLYIAENIHRARLLDKQLSVNRLATASNDPTLPLDPEVLNEGRQSGHDLESEGLKTNGDAFKVGKSMTDIIAAEKKAAEAQGGTTPTPTATPATTPTQTTGQQTKEPAVATTADQKPKVWHPQHSTFQTYVNQLVENTRHMLEGGQPQKNKPPEAKKAEPAVTATPAKTVSTPAKVASTPEGPDAYARSRMSPEELQLYDSSRDPSNINNPQVAHPEVSAAVQKYKNLVDEYNNRQTNQQSAQANQSTEVKPIKPINPPALEAPRILPEQAPTLNAPLGPQRIITPQLVPTAQNEELPENTEVGSYVSQVPTLSAQEHVDALEPGKPFRWNDGQIYVRT